MKKIDWYIIKKFLSTFFFTISLIILIVIIFDISEKIDDFLENDVSISKIIFDYYLNFIPYFINLFIPLFIFISVIFFTSKMAQNTEIIAILNSGMSFKRLLLPFLMAASFITLVSFVFGNFIVPESNKTRIDFENKYLKKRKIVRIKNIHLQIKPDQYIYLESYNRTRNIGYKFTLENFNNGKLISKLSANYIKFDTISKSWTLNDYTKREYYDYKEIINQGIKLDTSINLFPIDFAKTNKLVETMGMLELNKYIKQEEIKGKEQIINHKIEKHKRIAFPFSSIILTIIAVAIGSKKIKGGIGLNLGIGIILSFSYILFMQVSTTFAINGNLSPLVAVWIPNIIFMAIGMYQLKIAPK
jgi:lipopolysaccharide export system permease protein|tara:strand:+ start:11296 stop:12372 length:1077 start_codon:yes stop_codon:yes gene_type:complete